MKYFLLTSHPDPDSFNIYLAEVVFNQLVSRGAEVYSHDLYKEHFNPVLSLEEIQRKYSFDPVIQNFADEIEKSQHLIIIHPDWWGQPPAILKGWVDRVFMPGVAYEYEDSFSENKAVVPLLTGKRATVVITTNSEKTPLSITGIWEESILNFVGIDTVDFHILYNARKSSVQDRMNFINDIVTGLDEKNHGLPQEVKK